MLPEFEASLRRLVGLRAPQKLGISVSGGVDSMALAHLASRWAKSRDVRLYGFIINHHVRPESASEASLVADRLANLGIEPKILDLHANLVEPAVMERFARHGRRDLLQSECVANQIHHLLHGHTLDDQIELFIMRFLMRSTWYGLAGMHQVSYLSLRTPPDQYPIKLLKPLLSVRKQQLKDYCMAENVEWVEDPSNEDVNLTKRNAIRALLKDPAQLPSTFSPESLIPLIARLQQIREKTMDQATFAYMQMRNSGDLYIQHGIMHLKSFRMFDALPNPVKEQVMLMLMSQVSPLELDQLFYRRQLIHNYVADKFSKKRALFDVTVEPTGRGELQLRRSRPRANQSLEYTVYKATKSWSDWKLVDNRFWIRWKLPEEADTAERNINSRLLYSLANSTNTLKEIFDTNLASAYQRQTHPLFMFDDPEDPYTLRSDLIIGYPTLDYCRGLHMEWEHVSLPL